MEKSLTIYRYIKKIIVGKPFLKPLPHRNPLPHFTYSIFDPPCFPAKPIRLKKKKKQPSVDRPPQCFSFGILTLHTTCASLRSKNIFHPGQKWARFHSTSACLKPPPTPPPPPPPHLLSRHEPACSAGVGWSHDRVRYVTTPRPLTAALMDPSVCLAWVSYFFIHIYIKIEKYAHAL